MKRIPFIKVAAIAGIALAPALARATLLTVDQIIWQGGTGVNPGSLAGQLDYQQGPGNQATLTLTNISPDDAFSSSAADASRLLTGFGVQFGVNITGGTATVGGTAVNFSGGQSTTNISNQYGYANGPVAFYNESVTLPVDNVVTAVQAGGLSKFAGAGSLGGPDYGSLSTSETTFGSGQAAVRGSIVFYLTFDGAAPTFAELNAGNVVLAFGSPTTTGSSVPDQGSTIALFALGLSGLAFAARKLRGA